LRTAVRRKSCTIRPRTLADEIAAKLQTQRDVGAEYVLLNSTGGIQTLQRFAKEVLPAFGGRFPKAQWKTLRTTNTIERLHEEFRRRVKTQGSLPNEDAAIVLLFSLVASGQIKLRRIDGWRKIAAVLSQHTAVAA